MSADSELIVAAVLEGEPVVCALCPPPGLTSGPLDVHVREAHLRWDDEVARVDPARPPDWWFVHAGSTVTVPADDAELQGVVVTAVDYGRPSRLVYDDRTAVVVSGAWFDRMVERGLVPEPGEVL